MSLCTERGYWSKKQKNFFSFCLQGRETEAWGDRPPDGSLPNFQNIQDWARSRNLNFNPGWQEPKLLTCYLLHVKVRLSRKLESEMELGREPRHTAMDTPKRCPKCQA